MKSTAVIHMSFPTDRCVETILKALTPEITKPPTKRYQVVLTREGTTLILRIEAKDVVALRASTNAYLRWVSAISECIAILRNEVE